KSTLIERLLTKLSDVRAGGFYTREMRKDGARAGFKIVTVDKMEGVLAHVDSAGRVMAGKYSINLEAIDTVAVPAIERAVMHDDLIVIDEIGKMELHSKRFCEMVNIALDSDKPLVATVPSAGPPFVEDIKKRHDVRVVHLDIKNRDEVLEQAARLLREG
ncbi:MAG TPA: NTPase, partial [Nitrospirota bacterium]